VKVTGSLRSQKFLIWWALIFSVVFAAALGMLLHLLPPPSALWSADQVAQFYTEHSLDIRLGAAVMAVVSGFFIPFTIPVVAQMRRHEADRTPVWSMLTLVSGAVTSVTIFLPPVFFGTAAFTPTRPAEVTAVIHEVGLLMMITAAQTFVFMWVAVVVICLTPHTVAHSPFPRWFGYLTLWDALVLEVGVLAYLFKSGPFAWNGILAFWVAAGAFFSWMIVLAVLMVKAINRQLAEEQSSVNVPVAV
jgi:hypothetical protein